MGIYVYNYTVGIYISPSSTTFGIYKRHMHVCKTAQSLTKVSKIMSSNCDIAGDTERLASFHRNLMQVCVGRGNREEKEEEGSGE